MSTRTTRLAFLALVSSCTGCGDGSGSTAEPTSAATQGAESAPVVTDDGLGGRLYDNWYAALGIDFVPDDKKTPGVADGQGGPHGNGTLDDGNGQPLLNDAGHDYRLKNLFGWDLRGQEGIYGPDYQAKKTALPINLLSVAWSREQLLQRLAKGGEGVPALGTVLDAAQLGALVDFVFATRDGKLPQPAQLFALSAGTPGNYTLLAGGDAARGAQAFKNQCAGCHGTDGTKKLFDDGEYSLGSHARQKAYEDWFKMSHGQPGTGMKRQLPEGLDGAAGSAFLLDVLAALCDRTAFPRGAASAADVADGDPRCGAYLR
jgi:mono/diheme cytochrome c family protein